MLDSMYESETGGNARATNKRVRMCDVFTVPGPMIFELTAF